MSYAKKVVEEHGGTVSVESRRGRGDDGPHLPARRAGGKSNVMQPRRILVVDDEQSVTDALELILGDEGYDVKTADSVAEAVGLLSGGRPFDLVFTGPAPARLDRHRAAHRIKARRARHAGHADDRARLARNDHRSHQARRVLLRRKTFHPGPGLDAGGARSTVRRASGARTARSSEALATDGRDVRHHRARPAHAPHHRDDTHRRALGRLRPHRGRDRARARSSIAGAFHAAEQPRRRPVHPHQLRGHPIGANRVGTVRLQKGRLHRRGPRQARADRGRRGRDAPARRDRRDAAAPSDETAARATGAGELRRLGDEQRGGSRLPPHRLDEPRHRADDSRRAACAKTSTSASAPSG